MERRMVAAAISDDNHDGDIQTPAVRNAGSFFMQAFESLMNPYLRQDGINIDITDILVVPVNVYRDSG